MAQQNGWELLTLKMPGVGQSAPLANPNKMLSVFNVQSPVTNPQGEYYTQSDGFTGRQVLRRRVGWETKW